MKQVMRKITIYYYTLSTGLLGAADRPVSAPSVDTKVAVTVPAPSSLLMVFLLLPNGGVSDTKKFFIGCFVSPELVLSIVFLLLPKGGVNDERNPPDPWLL